MRLFWEDVQIGADSSALVLHGHPGRYRADTHRRRDERAGFHEVHADPGIPCLVGHRVTVGHRVILHGCVVEDECLIGMGAIRPTGSRSAPGRWWERAPSCSKGWKSPPGRSWSDHRPKWFARSIPGPPGADRPDLAALRRAGAAPSSRGVCHPTPQHRNRLIRRHEPAGRSANGFIDPAHRMARLRESTGAPIGPWCAESMRSKASQVSGRCGVPSPAPPSVRREGRGPARRMHASSSRLSPR